MNRLDVLKVFKTKLIEFIDALIEQFPSITELIVLRIFLAEQIPIDDVMQIFVARLVPYEKMVQSRDDKFFLEKSDIFEGVGSHHVNYFKTIWESDQVDDEDREQIWKWFELFIKISKQYQTSKM